METSTEKKIAAFTHLSTFSQYIIPFGNYIFPIILWTSKKDESEFVDHNGKQVLNFQLSILVYSLVLAMIAIPVFLYTVLKNISFNDLVHNEDIIFEHFDYGNSIGLLTIGALALLVFAGIKVAEFFLIIYASVKASNGEEYNYPLTIPFLK
ncbi:DUF4870 domain-containing protein [Flavobacterium sp. 5]|uniref:DUF4870 domain-containing protein n=1 Tax=Flavobacterium sp. 5 TaxID=2035199 RepID=UPI000C2C0F8E|nr:DUF4870 domain-containing protein [Flavobacterium sp. 5]PKB15744.1 hypothetical protein CLU82_0834 [Flavobacterium sp. 5]